MRSLWSWRKDRELLSNEKHEKYYARRLAKSILNNTKKYKPYEYFEVRVSKIRRICQLALKK